MSSHARSRVATNAAAGTAAQVIILAIGLITTPVILFSLGNAHYGAFALIGSLTAYFGILDLGIGGSLTRFMAFYQERGEPARINAFATFGIIFYLIIIVIILPILISTAPAISKFLGLPSDLNNTALLVMVLGLFLGWSLLGIIAARLAASHRLDLVAYANIFGSGVFGLLIFTFVPRYRTIESVFACMACQLVLVIFTLLIINHKLNGPLVVSPRRIKWHEMRELFSFGLWTQVASVTAVVNLEADKVIISRSIGIDSVAPYHVANRLALLSRTLPLQLLGSLLPAVTAEVSRGMSDDDIRDMYRRTARSLMVPTLVIVGFVAGSADALLRLWLGTHMEGATMLCIALVLSYAVNNITGAGTVILKAEGSPQLETFYGILSAVLNIGLTILLVVPFGLGGVVMGTILGNVIGSVTFVWLFHRRKRLAWWTTIGDWLTKLVLATGGAGLLVHGALMVTARSTTDRLFLLGILTIVGMGYLVICYLFGRVLSLWTEQDHAFIKHIGARMSRRTHGSGAV
jgi:O-antigen/teichoic acid export membrane protein